MPRGSLRLRLTLLSTGVVTAMLLATAVALTATQRSQLSDNLDVSLQQRADFVETRLDDDPTLVWFENIDSTGDDRGLQLVSNDGSVLAASRLLVDQPPLPVEPDVDGRDRITDGDPIGTDDDRYRVLTRPVRIGDSGAVLHVAQSADEVDEAVAALIGGLAIGLPIVVALLAGLLWWLVGRTLRPVDLIRRKVDTINATDSTHRLGVSGRGDEVDRLAATLNTMLDRLAASGEQQRRFVADAAHELRTPITRIRATLETGGDTSTDDAEAARRSVVAETVEMQHLIDDLLHLARSDAGHATFQQRPVDLDDIVLAEVAEQRTVTPGIEMDVRSVSAAHIMGDVATLTRAVRNVVTNAARHARRRVLVTLTQENGVVEFVVADDGPGVPPAHRAQIFDRFTRVDEARGRAGGGTGLGLAITRDIVVAHGGTITYDADYTDGARFVVRLPGLE